MFGHPRANRYSGRNTARVAELVDAPGLGPGAFGREGSNPFSRTDLISRHGQGLRAPTARLVILVHSDSAASPA